MNKIERVLTVLRGGIPDIVPSGYWFHYPSTFTLQERIDGHLKLFRETNTDVVKVMYEYGYQMDTPITTAADWYKIRPKHKKSPQYLQQLELIKGIVAEVQGDALVFATMFGPFKSAVMGCSDEMLMAHARENPHAVAAGIKAIGEELAEWAEGYLQEGGADGIYYSAQFGEPGRFTRAQWEQLIKPSDLEVLHVAQGMTGKYNIVHICGEPEYQFKTHVDRFGDYPGDLFNWATYNNQYELERGRDLFQRPILGGLDNRGVIVNGTPAEITQAVHDVIGKFGKQALMLGADCTLPGDIDLERIKIAVEAAASYENQ